MLEELKRAHKPWMLLDKGSEEAFFGEDGPVCKRKRTTLVAGDDGITHVGDENGHCWNSD